MKVIACELTEAVKFFSFGWLLQRPFRIDHLPGWPVDSTPDSAKRAFSELHLLKIVAPGPVHHGTSNAASSMGHTLNHSFMSRLFHWLIWPIIISYHIPVYRMILFGGVLPFRQKIRANWEFKGTYTQLAGAHKSSQGQDTQLLTLNWKHLDPWPGCRVVSSQDELNFSVPKWLPKFDYIDNMW